MLVVVDQVRKRFLVSFDNMVRVICCSHDGDEVSRWALQEGKGTEIEAVAKCRTTEEIAGCR